MTAKIEAAGASAVEPRMVEMSGTTNSSASSTGTQKVSKFAAKSGFVIPKNKLSGSLVPIFRGNKNVGSSDAVSGESKKQFQRKTKWGPDLTQDASVLKGRALAYQTRVDQITQQLESGMLEAESEDLTSATEDAAHKSPRHQIDREDVEQLELEKREAIGEILKLNPSYRAPPDYKPVLKEATVPVPVKEYPRYNFVGLIYGPENDNQKHLEKETGAKIQVYGTKAGTGEKAEIRPSDGNEIQSEYEKINVHVSADTFEKVDAAVAVIELLVTSVSGNLAANTCAGDNAHVRSQGPDTATPNMIPAYVVNQGMVQPEAGPVQTPPNGQFQYPGPFFSMGPSSIPMNMHGFTPSRPIPNHPSYLSAPPFNFTNQPSFFGSPPALVSPRQHQPTQILQHTYMAQTSLGPVGPTRTNFSAPLTFMGNQPPPTGSSSIISPFVPSFPQHVSNHLPGSQPAGSTTGWSGGAPAPQPGVAPMPPPSNISTGNMVSSVTFPPGPSTQLSSAPVNHPIAALSFTPIPRPQLALPFSGSAPAPSTGPVTSLAPPLQPRVPSSVSGSVPNFTPLKPPMMSAPRSGDFTFQPHRPQNPSFQTVTQPTSQFSAHNASPATPILLPPAPQAPSFQLPAQNMTHHPSSQMLLRPQVGDRTGPTPPNHISAVPFAPRAPHQQMRPRNFNPAHQMPNLPGPPRPGNHLQIQQNYPPHSTRPEIPRTPNQHFSNNPAFASGMSASSPRGQLLYDPFSPNSNSKAGR